MISNAFVNLGICVGHWVVVKVQGVEGAPSWAFELEVVFFVKFVLFPCVVYAVEDQRLVKVEISPLYTKTPSQQNWIVITPSHLNTGQFTKPSFDHTMKLQCREGSWIIID